RCNCTGRYQYPHTTRRSAQHLHTLTPTLHAVTAAPPASLHDLTPGAHPQPTPNLTPAPHILAFSRSHTVFTYRDTLS
ncbi:hypothetical protein BCR44DRAFT_1514562, partial [Catenaria anguillulae PL171]